MAIILFLSGPPKAGKSRLRGDLTELLRRSTVRRWFVEVLSPDSEGAWTSDAWRMGRGPEAEALARRYKNLVKEAGHFFSPAFVMRKRAQLEGLLRWAELVIGDLGGIPSPENAEIIGAAAGHRVIPVVLTRDGQDGGWIKFWRDRGLEPVVASYHEALAAALLPS
ncbi:MAG TPA: hypothetical protein VIL08_03465 [Limnochorda sp.]